MTQPTPQAFRRRTILGAALAAIGAAAAATPPEAQAAYGGDLVALQVIDRETGAPIEVWTHEGRAYVAGQPGARYALRFSNHTGGRVLVVASVDGVNILTGQTAAHGQRGYVLDPYETYDITGWRKSDSEVAAFNFAALSRSYAARTGRPGNVGVIGIAAFRERGYDRPKVVPQAGRARRGGYDSEADEVITARRAPGSPYEPIPAPPPAPSAALGAQSAAPRSPMRGEKLGTGHGEREWSSVVTVPFERATPYPQMVRQIEYDTYERLAAAGVVPARYGGGRRPRPFPGSGGYVPDPPGEY